MEKLLIICEKATAAENFSKALGGFDGVFDNCEYHIMSLSGHLLKLPEPKETAFSEYSDYIGGFSKVDSAPWKFEYFDFHKYAMDEGRSKQKAINAVKEFKEYTNDGYIPVIATDLDTYCEGDLIGYMLLKYCDYKGKIYRELHTNEGVEAIQKAIRERFLVTYGYKNFLVGRGRQMSDFLTQCLTRVATNRIRKQGYQIDKAIPVGRLKSVISLLVGDQWIARETYKPSSTFEYRYKLDSLVLSNAEMEKFKTIEELHNSGIVLPEQATVKKVKETFGTTPPSKLLTMDSLVSRFSKDVPVETVRKTLQALYEAGYVSYPRTDEDVISREDFHNSLPKIDTYIKSLDLNVALFTHRQERKTHVVEKVTHGGLMPGHKLVKSLDELSSFGKLGVEIYKQITFEFLKMFLEDTEWVRYDYETVDVSPVFKGSVRVITKQGVINEDDEENNKDFVSVLPNLNNKAVRYEHEAKSVMPAKPTIAWLLKQLKKFDVGTPATRVSTLEDLIGGDEKPFKLVKAELTLTKIGLLAYEVAKVIKIGSVEGTKSLHKLLKGIRDGELTLDDLYVGFEDILSDDIATLRDTLFSLEKYGFTKDKIAVEWEGQTIVIDRSKDGYVFSEDEINRLAKGETITYEILDKFKRKFKVNAKIGRAISKKTGNEYIAVLAEYINLSKVKGIWNGQEVSIPRKHGEHVFTNEELKKLFNGEEIEITTKNVTIIGKLNHMEYNGNKFVGFDGNVKQSKVNRVSGQFNGRDVEFSAYWGSHKFTEDEIKALLEGKTISFKYKDKKKNTRTASGKLEDYEYNGKACFGFKASKF